MTKAALTTELAALLATIGTTRAALEAGDLVDVTGLDRAVAELCAAAGALPAAERGAAISGLARLADDLAGIAAALAAQKAALERGEEAAARRRAAGAYPSPA